MIPLPAHDRLLHRDVFTTTVVCQSALHVGSGRDTGTVAPTDLPLIRNGAGQPFIPGSSFRGVLRAGLEALLRSLPKAGRVCDPVRKPKRAEQRGGGDGWEAPPEDPDVGCSFRIADRKKELAATPAAEARARSTEEAAFELAAAESCELCRLFGNTFFASRVWIEDLVLAGTTAPYVRNGVGIDRDLRSVAKGVLYDFEAVPAGTQFALNLQVENGLDHELGLLLTGLGLVGSGLFLVGGKKARGLGKVSLGDIAMRRWTAADFFTTDEPVALPKTRLAELREAARRHYLKGVE